MRHPTALSTSGTVPETLVFASLLFGLVLGLLPAQPASAQYGLKPRLYTSGATVRRAFSEVNETARAATVEILDAGKVCALGVVVADDGWVLTKSSEFTAPQVTVRLSSAEEFPADVIGRHDATDLALLKIDARDLTPIQWEDQPDALVGQWVISSGLRSTPQAIGVVSTARRSIKAEREPGVLGVGLDGEDGPPKVTRVFSDSGAEAAGIKAGDIIEQINGRAISSRAQMIRFVQEYNPGDALDLRIRRDDSTLELQVTLTPPPTNDFRSRISIQNRMGGDLSRRRNGFEAVIQHDSVLRPDECGGPAVTLSGKALGINIARAGRTETYALPADLILPVIEELRLQAPTSTVSKD